MFSPEVLAGHQNHFPSFKRKSDLFPLVLITCPQPVDVELLSRCAGTKAGGSLHRAELKPVADGLIDGRTCLSPVILMCFGLVTPSRVFLQTVLVAKLLWEGCSIAVGPAEDILFILHLPLG